MKRLACLLFLCLAAFTPKLPEGAPPPAAAERLARKSVADVLDALAHRDFKRLAAHVGEQGLALSPYVTLDDGDVRLSRAEVEQCTQDPRVRHWGEMDGSGDPIEVTCGGYFEKFVWNADYRKADEVLYNEPRQRGNDTNNNHTFVPGSIVVELHIRGKGDQAAMNWKSLRLIFRDSDQGLRLIAVTRDVWTI
jgi:hypothetical protein